MARCTSRAFIRSTILTVIGFAVALRTVPTTAFEPKPAPRAHFTPQGLQQPEAHVPEFSTALDTASTGSAHHWYEKLGWSGGWLQAEGMTWWTSSADIPALVTTGVLGQPGTQTLYGNSSELDDVRGGVRLRGGLYLDCCRDTALDAELFILPEVSAVFAANSNSHPFLARPFLNANAGNQPDAQFVSFPGLNDGDVRVRLENSMKSFAVRYNSVIARDIECEADCVRGIQQTQSHWAGVRFGYRFIDLNETLSISETFLSIPTSEQFEITDRFDTDNQFHGFEFGLVGATYRGRIELETAAGFALGITRHRTRASGRTRITQGGTTTSHAGGVLAQRTNSGETASNDFSIVPQFELNGAYRLSRKVKVTVGYSLMYWHEVLRAGDQIDPVINPNLFPPEAVPFSGPLRPTRPDRKSGLLAHGLSFGAEYRW